MTYRCLSFKMQSPIDKPNTMKKILIPIDFSKVTESALIVAREIARKNTAEVELLHIVDAPHEEAWVSTGEVRQADNMADVFIMKSMETADKRMKKIMNDVKYAGVRFRHKLKVGDETHNFAKFINEENPELIIIGTEGNKGFFKGIFNSSHAEKVVTHANCMVLSVKYADESFKIRNVVFATNFEDDSPVFMEELIRLQECFEFKLHIIYVDALLGNEHDSMEVKKKKEAFCIANNISDFEFHIIKDFTEYSGIIDYADKVKADVIALSTHQHKGLHLLGGVSEDLVNCSVYPILTYKASS
jgi:nucleotide-binding universal stress UspA family protein